jgi:SNF2 family DNA or RNA helicase
MPHPFPYQLEDADWLARELDQHKARFIWHDMGTGKSLIMILTAQRLGARRIVVFVPAIGRENWRRQVQLWWPDGPPVFVVGVDGAVPPHPWNGWVIVNYERLQLKNTDLLAALARDWDLAVLDEHHYAANPEAQRTEIFYKVDALRVERLAHWWHRVILSSGTPMRNSPLDLWPHLYVWFPASVSRDGHRMGRDAWKDAFCVTKPVTLPSGVTVEQVTGGRNEHDLLRRLEGTYRRRRREDVLRDLPALHVMPHHLHTYGLARDKLTQAAQKLDVDVLATVDDIADALENSDDAAAAYGALEFAALARVSSVLELVDDLITPDPVLGGSNRKMMLLAHHHSIMDELFEGCQNLGLRPVQIRGGQTPQERQRYVDLYQADPTVRVVVVQLQAGSTAIDLTATTDVIFAELDWTATNNAQCIARAYRQGTTQQVQARLVLGDTPIERGQARVIARRLESIVKVTPGQIEQALIDALNGRAPTYPQPQLGASDDWLDGIAAPAPAPTATADWLE